MDAIQEKINWGSIKFLLTTDFNFGSIDIFLTLLAGVSGATLLPLLTLFVYRIVVWVVALFIRHKQWQMEVLDALYEELKTALGRPRMSYLQFFQTLYGDGELREQDELVISRIVDDFYRRRPLTFPKGWSKDDQDLGERKFLLHWAVSIDNLGRGRWYTIITSCFYHHGLDHYLGNGIALTLILYIASGCGLEPGMMVMLAIGSGVTSCLGGLIEVLLLPTRDPPDDDPRDELDLEVDACIYNTQMHGSSGIISGFAAALPFMCPQARGLLFSPVWLFFLYGTYCDVKNLSRRDIRECMRYWLEREKATEKNVAVIDVAPLLTCSSATGALGRYGVWPPICAGELDTGLTSLEYISFP
ncbi:hypothetical protein PG984_012912 [Apiospora sp. TS-2023a]